MRWGYKAPLSFHINNLYCINTHVQSRGVDKHDSSGYYFFLLYTYIDTIYYI